MAELAVSTRVSELPAGMNGAVNFNGELNAWRAKISDECAHDNLTAKRHPQLARLESGPEGEPLTP